MTSAVEGSRGLTAALNSSPQKFLQPTLPLYTDALAYLKHALDPLAADISKVQLDRQQEARKKRKRGEQLEHEEVLRLKQVHTHGFSAEQVWEQSRRVVDAASQEVTKGLDAGEVQDPLKLNGDANSPDEEDFSTAEDGDLGEEGVDYEVEGPDVDGEGWEDEEESEDLDANMDGQDNFDELQLEEDGLEDDVLGNDEPPDEFIADKFGLNDGFFSIDDFNRKSEFLEQQDARGEDDGAASDEEDIDYEADPLANGMASLDNEDADMGDEEAGPTFGDPDASSEGEGDELDAGDLDAMGGMSNTNHVMYAHFFAPPAQKKRKNKKGRPNPHNFPAEQANGTAEAEDDDMERTMAAVHRDLFDDDESEQDDDNAEQLDPSDPKSRKSTHERRKAATAEEIRKLEAANVAKREWTLSGEARAADRPLNSLLEEDLDFERAGKPVPVITAEVSESIEDLIKRRILAHDFQDIARRRPDDLATGKDAKRGRLDFELDDNKSKKGLAEEYEEEHLRKTDSNFVDVKDEKLKTEEKEIEALWKKLSAELDSLSSWNFRPKQPVPTLDIRVDAPAIGMEDARPSAGGAVAGASQLAPQEVYKGGESGKGIREEVVGKSGLPSGREEMSREEKKRRRRREKERIKKAGTNETPNSQHKKVKQQEMVGDLKRGGVKVIGKKGEVQDVEGRQVSAGATGPQGAGRFKL